MTDENRVFLFSFDFFNSTIRGPNRHLPIV